MERRRVDFREATGRLRLCVRTTLAFTGLVALCACRPAPQSAPAHADKVLRMVPQSDLEILDPVWTTALITQDHGYMIYDTLFGMDASGRVSPQMVETWDVSADKKIWTFTLRDGLEFHDGLPVTSDDVIASLQRWGQRDTMGRKLMSFVEGWEAVNARTFRLTLKEPYGLVLESFGKPGSNVPFIMPRRVAATPVSKQIDDTTGSGPFVFSKDQWRPGEKVVYLRNAKYRPRAEPASGTSGGKTVKVDRVEWVVIKDAQTAVNALAAGEVDLIEMPAYEQYPALESNAGIQMVEPNPIGAQFSLHFNHLAPPFNKETVRQAAMAALNQPAFLQTQVGIPGRYRTCFSVYPCSTPYFTTTGMDFIARPDVNRARQLLGESGYDGTPVVIMQPTDLAIIAKLPVVAAQLLRDAGFKVDMQSMDWQTLVSRRAKKDAWNIFLTGAGAEQVENPISNNMLSAACDKAFWGWACDAKLETLRDAFARAGDDQARKALAEQIQARAMEIGALVPLGEYVRGTAARRTVTGFVTGYFLVLWNLEKQ